MMRHVIVLMLRSLPTSVYHAEVFTDECYDAEVFADDCYDVKVFAGDCY